MKTTKLIVSEKSMEQFDGDLLVYCVAEAKKDALVCDSLIRKQLIHPHEYGDFSGKADESLLFYPLQEDGTSALSARRVLVVGLGKFKSDQSERDHSRKEKSEEEKSEEEESRKERSRKERSRKERGEKERIKDEQSEDDRNGRNGENQDLYEIRDTFRKAGGTIAKVCARVKAAKIMVSLPHFADIHPGDIAECLAEGILLGDYRFRKYKKENEQEPEYQGLSEVKLVSTTALSVIRRAVKQGIASAQAACEARDMANEPGNGWKPSDFAAYAEKLSQKYALKCTVINKKKMEKLGMGGLLAVNQGSVEEPKMVILEYRPGGQSQTILLVGKGITFDSGGISLKPATGMEDMKYDMCGGAAVIAAMQAVGQEKPGVGVVAIIPATDNLSGSAAVKPGDIIRHYNGVTSEIINTDAEGRLILADALAYGIETYNPDCVVDIATLTGAVVTGLGHHYSGILGNNDELINCLEEAGRRAGEPLWRLPLGKPYSKQIESKVADIKNTGGKSAGTITAAAYLEHFVGDTPWAHIDIAGTAWDFTKKSYIPKGPSGTGVRTFLELIRHWKKNTLKNTLKNNFKDSLKSRLKG